MIIIQQIFGSFYSGFHLIFFFLIFFVISFFFSRLVRVKRVSLNLYTFNYSRDCFFFFFFLPRTVYEQTLSLFYFSYRLQAMIKISHGRGYPPITHPSPPLLRYATVFNKSLFEGVRIPVFGDTAAARTTEG